MRKTIVFLSILAMMLGCASSFKSQRAQSKPMVSIAMEKISRDDLQGALVELRKAIDANPSDPEAYYALSVAYWKMDKLDKALESIEKAIDNADKLELEHPGMESESYNLKGSILMSKGMYEDAIAAFQRAVKDDLYSTPEYAYYNLAAAYMEMKNLDLALDSSKKSLEKNPHYAPAWKILAWVYVQQGNDDKAIEALKHAVAEFNGYTDAYWDLAQIYIRRGQFKEARENLNEVINLDPNGTYGTLAEEKIQEMNTRR